MTLDPRLDALPRFHVRTVAPRTAETMLVSGRFTRPEHISLDDRGWLFVSETESTIADVVSVDCAGAGLDVPNWSMTKHVHEGAVLPWLDCRWQARDLAFLLDRARQWRRVKYEATDAVVLAKRTLKCAQCGWTGGIEAELTRCPKCASELTPAEIFGNQEAAFPLDADSQFVETRSGFWDSGPPHAQTVRSSRRPKASSPSSSYLNAPRGTMESNARHDGTGVRGHTLISVSNSP
jgi:hypothetical protein